MLKAITCALAFLIPSLSAAVTQGFMKVTIPSFFGDETLRLEYYEHLPKKWNGHVILMSHGSTGGNRSESTLKTSIKFLNIGKLATSHGFIFVVLNRKGRGQSEGTFTEESQRCDTRSLTNELDEAETQLNQFAKQIREKHNIKKLILMGHSRGGLLSAHYAGKNPGEVSAVVNLAGGWSTMCEQRNGGFGKYHLENSAKNFKNQYWIYFENDSYFKENKFGDPEYQWMRAISQQYGIEFHQFSDSGRVDGHQAPTWTPKEWASIVLPRLRKFLENQ